MSPRAANGQAAKAAGPERLKVPPLSREQQVYHVRQLLTQRGDQIESEVRDRVAAGEGVMAGGLWFDASVLADALHQWSLAQAETGSFMLKLKRKRAVVEVLEVSEDSQGGPCEGGAEATGSGTTMPSKAVTVRRKRAKVVKDSPEPTTPMPPVPSVPSQPPASCSPLRSAAGPSPGGSLDEPIIKGSLRDRLARRAGATASSLGLPRVATPCRSVTSSPRHQELEAPSMPDKSPRLAFRLRLSPRVQASPSARRGASVRAEAMRPEPEAKSVKELKLLLAEAGLGAHTIAGCVEKADLELLWARLEQLRRRPLPELQASCREKPGGFSFTSTEECIRFLLEPAGSHGGQSAPSPPREMPVAVGDAQAEAQREVDRILPLRRETFASAAAWGFQVLGVVGLQDLAAAQRGYRTLMRKLHPDKAGASPPVARAAEMAREAREACERGLSGEEPPRVPCFLQCTTICAAPGSRKFRLTWQAPGERKSAPIRKYIVAALDPAYGRPLTVAVLEPDYSEELRRFVSVEELTSFTLAEQDLQKMPSLWQQLSATLKVAAANEAGQSPWATLQIRLAPPVATAAAAQAQPKRPKPEPKEERKPDEERSFGLELRKHRGPALRTWLEAQQKANLTSWLRSVRWPSTGSKEDLVARIIFVSEGCAGR